MLTLLSIFIAYLLGSINSAMLMTRYLKLSDPRTIGSGNPGATNILRTMGKNPAIIVFIGDALKGVAAVLLARLLGIQGFTLGLVALASVLGHVFPVFFKFRGGKGAATMIGATLTLTFWVGVFTIIVWAAIAFLFRYASLASIAAVICAPLFMLVFGNHQYAFPLLLIAAFVVWRHWDNIKRLRQGIESKLKTPSQTKQKQETQKMQADSSTTKKPDTPSKP